ncbi:PREDICTED: RING-H2 finger protein ATL48-like [Nelumbo nucifera]|uniref:RING-H2 finger protein ATL48-like n=1 Tax=Nelumbo nucifera TaxID=4432 RepID=A0A1U7ZM61_NELNU|nr:PREDICTED: RING-H2 finger protein ATL48-like [Nelumbo nucifera]
MEKISISDSELECLFNEKRCTKNPLVPIGELLTGVFIAGLITSRQGNSQLGQKIMKRGCIRMFKESPQDGPCRCCKEGKSITLYQGK